MYCILYTIRYAMVIYYIFIPKQRSIEDWFPPTAKHRGFSLNYGDRNSQLRASAKNDNAHSGARCEIWCACRGESEIAQRRALWDLVRVPWRIRDRTAARVVEFGALAAAYPRSHSGAHWEIRCACYMHIFKTD